MEDNSKYYYIIFKDRKTGLKTALVKFEGIERIKIGTFKIPFLKNGTVLSGVACNAIKIRADIALEGPYSIFSFNSDDEAKLYYELL